LKSSLPAGIFHLPLIASNLLLKGQKGAYWVCRRRCSVVDVWQQFAIWVWTNNVGLCPVERRGAANSHLHVLVRVRIHLHGVLAVAAVAPPPELHVAVQRRHGHVRQQRSHRHRQWHLCERERGCFVKRTLGEMDALDETLCSGAAGVSASALGAQHNRLCCTSRSEACSDDKVANRNTKVWHREWSLNDGRIPNFRGLRSALGTGYNRVEGNRRASRNKPA
jgi:hypothetical protein